VITPTNVDVLDNFYECKNICFGVNENAVFNLEEMRNFISFMFRLYYV